MASIYFSPLCTNAGGSSSVMVLAAGQSRCVKRDQRPNSGTTAVSSCSTKNEVKWDTGKFRKLAKYGCRKGGSFLIIGWLEMSTTLVDDVILVGGANWWAELEKSRRRQRDANARGSIRVLFTARRPSVT